MLILMRRKEEEIIIGGNIRIKVLKIIGNQVHLGINAPKEITVYRGEILEDIENNGLHLSEDKDGNC